MLRSGISTEVRWLLFYVCALTFVGASFGYGREACIFSLLSYLIWQFYHLKKLESWVTDTRQNKPVRDELNGVWGEIAEDVKLLGQRYEKDKLRLQSVVSRVQEMTSALHDGVVLADKRGNIEWWNKAATELLGLREIDVGHPLSNILRDPQFQAYFEAGDYDDPLEMESYKQEGQRLLFQVHPFGNGEHLIIVRDITRVAKLEQMRRDFVANVSHELRTPLTVIRGYVETLASMPDLHPVVLRAMQQMEQQGARMTSLVNDLIVLTKLETDDRHTQTQSVDVKQLVDLVFNDGRAISEHQLDLINEVPSGLLLRGNEKELHSAVSNLVLNAVKYASADAEKPCSVKVYAEQNDNVFTLHVKDNGIGIDPKHIPRLTERFYRVDKGRSTSAGGTGLGLAIVKHVLLRHDALLKIDSLPGKGSTFSCCFPTSRLSSTETAH